MSTVIEKWKNFLKLKISQRMKTTICFLSKTIPAITNKKVPKRRIFSHYTRNKIYEGKGFWLPPPLVHCQYLEQWLVSRRCSI